MKVKQISRRRRIAALPHVCTFCGHEILRGQFYINLVVKEGEKFKVYKYHEPRSVDKDECTWPGKKGKEKG